MRWFKSSYSTNGGDCVEVAEGHNVLIRDTKHRQHGHLSFDHQAWAHLLNTLQRRR
ncbi:DUF397 domain-containing protein [Nocardiopsis ganjiahuensis]|uniref:DUF397 domain-containing protein n=1 Tax=Nocardiopsis ganjiahuensis TaxID=239984 RepID=UPI000348E9C1|nr:DUF397 domain-containing protein [Nocardiopsis ganjiahuensis]